MNPHVEATLAILNNVNPGWPEADVNLNVNGKKIYRLVADFSKTPIWVEGIVGDYVELTPEHPQYEETLQAIIEYFKNK